LAESSSERLEPERAVRRVFGARRLPSDASRFGLDPAWR